MGPRFAGPIAIIRNWTYCLFYVMAELWGSVVVSVLFWGFANQVRARGSGARRCTCAQLRARMPARRMSRRQRGSFCTLRLQHRSQLAPARQPLLMPSLLQPAPADHHRG